MSAVLDSSGAASPTPTVTGLILAAGRSSRMGADKALLMYRGTTFLENIISALRAAGVARIVVVLGHHAEIIQQSVDLATVEVVVNPNYGRGQTSSLQAGIHYLAKAETDAVVLCLVDHPALSADTVHILIHNFMSFGRPVVIPVSGGKHGHPVLIGRELFDQILALGPGQGADSVIHKYHDRSAFVEVADRGILLDVDDPESYRRLSALE